MPPKKQPETAIRKAVRDYLKVKGWFVLTILQGIGAHRGISDLIAVKNGVVAWIEIKTPTGRLSDYQEKFKFEMEAHGGIYVVMRSLDDAIEWESNNR